MSPIRLLLCLSVVFTPSVLAAPPAAEKSYRVEAIVFAQPATAGEEERWPTAATLPPALETVNSTADLSADSKLTSALQALKGAPYRVLTQASWTQVATDKAATKPIALRSADGALDGTVLFYVSRFLHSEINLRLRAQPPVATSAATATAPQRPAVAGGSGGDNSAAVIVAPAAAEATAIPVYRLSERRRIKSAETHYFDHPKFGVLLRVTPL